MSEGVQRSTPSAGRLAGKIALLVAFATLVAVEPFRREFVIGTTQEFANYGDLARHILAGDGPQTGLGQPADLRYLHDRSGTGAPPPWPTLFRPLGPAYLTAGLMRLVGPVDWAVVAPALLGFAVTAGLTVALGETFFGAGIGMLAALPYLASRPILVNAYNAYPDSIFSAGIGAMLLVFLGTDAGRRPAGAIALGVCAGLGQLLRVNMVGWLPCLVGIVGFLAAPGRRLRTMTLFTLGFAAGGSPEWVYALRHAGGFTRGLVGLENMANVKYGQTWLWYVPLSGPAIVAEFWRPILGQFAGNLPSLTLQVLSGVEGPTAGLAVARRAIVFGLYAGAGVLAWRGVLPERLRRLFFAITCMALWQVAMFSILRQGLRYFYWFIPPCWMFVLWTARWLAERMGGERHGRLLWRGGAVALAGLLGAHAVLLIAGRRPVDAEIHGFSPAELRQVRDEQLPALRALLPGNAWVASDRAYVLWYLGNPTIPLPLSASSLGGIERDYLPVDFIYLTGPFFRDMPGDPEDYVRAYFREDDGRVASGRDRRLARFLTHYPEHRVVREFTDGGVLLRRAPRGSS